MRLLIYEPSFRRLEAEIAALGPAVEPLLMSASGEVSLHGGPVPEDQVAADAAWTNADVFFSPVARAFMVAMLKSPGLKWVQSGAAGFDHPASEFIESQFCQAITFGEGHPVE